jgi:hypothetical protein
MNTETPMPDDPAPGTAEPSLWAPDGTGSVSGVSGNGDTVSGAAAWPAVAPPGGPYNTGHLPAATDAGAAAAWQVPVEPTVPAVSRRAQILVGLAVAVVIGALGFPLGRLWSAVAPWLPAQLSGGNLYYADPEGEQLAGQESWFILLSIGTGILFALITWFALRRFRGPVTVAALALGSVATGWIAWWYGHNIGLAHARDVARHAKDGAIIKLPPALRIKSPGNVAFWHHIPYLGGVILYVAVAALVVYSILAYFNTSPSLEHRRTAQPSPAAADPTAD